eukprot:TRINITY_DN13810_c0_g1_i1.p1 TRINITY_DN13810_c0_g1~~TRINITY_DN13810_c0_g1_i1.p1  ORF type:complete len:942 (+),score=191.12 TRINITY_DN13810_c0_g1_i1:70-2895(+)
MPGMSDSHRLSRVSDRTRWSDASSAAAAVAAAATGEADQGRAGLEVCWRHCCGHAYRLTSMPVVVIAGVTTAAIYADLAMAIQNAVRGEQTRFVLGLSFWVGAGVMMAWRGRSSSLGGNRLWCIPRCCRDICCRSDEEGVPESGDDSGHGWLLTLFLTLVHLQLIREAFRYVSELKKAVAYEKECRELQGKQKNWDDAMQQHQIRFLSWQRATAITVSAPQVVLQGYFQISLNDEQWFGLLSVGISIVVMAFAFSSSGADPFRVGCVSFVRDLAFQLTYLASHLGGYALLAGCGPGLVGVAIAGSMVSNAAILHATSAHVLQLDCCRDGCGGSPCEVVLRALLICFEQCSAQAQWPGFVLECTERVVFLDVSRMYVWEWSPFHRPTFRNRAMSANWYIFWKNSLFTVAMLAATYARSGEDDFFCPRYDSTVDTTGPDDLPQRLIVVATLHAVNIALFLCCLNDPHEPIFRQADSCRVVMVEEPGEDIYSSEPFLDLLAHRPLSCTDSDDSVASQNSSGMVERPELPPGAVHLSKQEFARLGRSGAGLGFASGTLLLTDVVEGSEAAAQGFSEFIGQQLETVCGVRVECAEEADSVAVNQGLVSLSWNSDTLLVVRKDEPTQEMAAVGFGFCDGDPLLQSVQAGSLAERQGAALFLGRRVQWVGIADQPPSPGFSSTRRCATGTSSSRILTLESAALSGSSLRSSLAQSKWQHLRPVSSAAAIEHLCRGAVTVRMVFDLPRLQAGDRVLVRTDERGRWVRGTVRQVSKRHADVQPDFFFGSPRSAGVAGRRWRSLRRPSAVVERHPFSNAVCELEASIPVTLISPHSILRQPSDLVYARRQVPAASPPGQPLGRAVDLPVAESHSGSSSSSCGDMAVDPSDPAPVPSLSPRRVRTACPASPPPTPADATAAAAATLSDHDADSTPTAVDSPSGQQLLSKQQH